MTNKVQNEGKHQPLPERPLRNPQSPQSRINQTKDNAGNATQQHALQEQKPRNTNAPIRNFPLKERNIPPSGAYPPPKVSSNLHPIF